VYKPTVINVVCDGTGTPLSDALARVNPTAAVYEIVINGTCSEQITLKNFASLTLRSAAGQIATIGRVVVDNGNSMVTIRDLQIKRNSTDAAVSRPRLVDWTFLT